MDAGQLLNAARFAIMQCVELFRDLSTPYVATSSTWLQRVYINIFLELSAYITRHVNEQATPKQYLYYNLQFKIKSLIMLIYSLPPLASHTWKSICCRKSLHNNHLLTLWQHTLPYCHVNNFTKC